MYKISCVDVKMSSRRISSPISMVPPKKKKKLMSKPPSPRTAANRTAEARYNKIREATIRRAQERAAEATIRRAQERAAADVAADRIASAFMSRNAKRIGKGDFGETKLIRVPGTEGRMVIAKYFTGGNAERNKIQEEKKHSEVYDVLRRSKTCHSVGGARICCKDIVVKPLLRGVHPRISLQESAQKPGARLLSYSDLYDEFPHLVPAADRALGVAKGCLHAHGFTHKDMHGENILYLLGDKGVEGIRIIDWGMYGAVRINKRGGVETVKEQLNRFVSKTMAPSKGVLNFRDFKVDENSSKGKSFLKAVRAAGNQTIMGNPNLEFPEGGEVPPYIATVIVEKNAAARKVQRMYRNRRAPPASKNISKRLLNAAKLPAPKRASRSVPNAARIVSKSAPRNVSK